MASFSFSKDFQEFPYPVEGMKSVYSPFRVLLTLVI